VFAGTDAADMRAAAKGSVAKASAAETSAANASDVTSANNTAAAHVAADTDAAAKTSGVAATTTAAARVGRACQQVGSEKSGGQYRDHLFHHDTPFRRVVRRHDARTSTSHATETSDD
jgi:hypothetical protein